MRNEAVSVDELRDIHLPPDLPWIQPTPLWWILPLACIAVAVLALIKWQHRRRAASPLFQARLQLEICFGQWREDGDRVAYLHSAAAALKLLAIRRARRNTTARLTGNDWISWLNAQGSQPLGAAGEQALTTELYQQDPQTNITELHQTLNTWLQHHGKPTHA